MSIALSKVNAFTAAVANGHFNLASDQLKVALTNTAHTSTWLRLTDLTQISYTNLSGATPLNLTTTSSTQTSGTYSLIVADLTLTALGSVGPFQYIYIYDDTASIKDLICYYNYGSAVTMASGDTFVIDLDNTNGVLQIA